MCNMNINEMENVRYFLSVRSEIGGRALLQKLSKGKREQENWRSTERGSKSLYDFLTT